jgi:dUTP pyrophosphatase
VELRVKLLHPEAKLPVCAHPGEDLGFDVFSIEDTVIDLNGSTTVRTGIALEMRGDLLEGFAPYGLLVRDRSSLASKGVSTVGGVIDAGYRGEILIKFVNHTEISLLLVKGSKVAQLIPVLPKTSAAIVSVSELSNSERGTLGFGSTGR